jgi:hypothetical protein
VTVTSSHDNCASPVSGVSLRDYFAAMIMQGLAQRMNAAVVQKYAAHRAIGREAIVAYAIADAMLQERLVIRQDPEPEKPAERSSIDPVPLEDVF